MRESKDIAIRMEGVKKEYRLGAIGGRTLQEDMKSWWAHKRGKADPNLRIGTDIGQFGSRFWAINGIDLTIYRGERVGIIGRNGAGKSTLLKLLSRITAPTEGDIDIWGKISSLLEVGTGFHRDLTGRENIYMNGAILGMKKAEIDAKIRQIIAFSEIENFIDTPVKRYSSGMVVKLGFAVAAFLDSDILVMDEVLAVGDIAFQRKCLDKMREKADAEGKTVLYVSHNMETIRRLCERCIVLDQGKILFDGDVEKAISVYLGANIGENPVDVSLDGKSDCRNNDVKLTHITLKDKMLPVYTANEILTMIVTFTVNIPMEAICLRLTLRNEENVGIGTAWSQPFSLTQTGLRTVTFSMPLDRLVKGNFYVSIGIYRTDEIGRKVSRYHVTRAFQIEIEGDPIWNTNAYGYARLSDIKVVDGGLKCD